MTKSEYQELVEFLARRFDRVDRRFDAMDERFDAMDERFDGVDKRFDGVDERAEGWEQRLHRAEILAEDTCHQVRIVAEGVATVDRKLEDFRSEVADSFRDLDVRLTRVEGHLAHRGAH